MEYLNIQYFITIFTEIIIKYTYQTIIKNIHVSDNSAIKYYRKLK